MTTATTVKPKASRTAKAAASPLRGHMVRVRTNAELLADMRAQGRAIRKTKESALAFLQSAGIVDANGELAEPYRA